VNSRGERKGRGRSEGGLMGDDKHFNCKNVGENPLKEEKEFEESKKKILWKRKRKKVRIV
jgi:hypothetical protein